MMKHLLGIVFMMVAAAAWPSTVQYQYDSEQRLTRAVYPGGAQVDYTYDATGNVLTAAATGSAAQGTVKVRVTPTTANWTLTDSAGALHSGTGNQDIAGVPLGRIDAFWKPLAGLDAPQPNPSYAVITSSAGVNIQGIYTTPRTAVADWTFYE